MRSEISADHLLISIVSSVLNSASMTVIDGSFHEQLCEVVDPSTTDALAVEDILKHSAEMTGNLVLDFGCGTGQHRQMLESFGYEWVGVNYSSGMATEAASQAKQNNDIDFYDGLVLPYEDKKFDVVYSYQTFEHIQSIETTFAEISRVLKIGGKLIGQVSYMEQIHDYSTFNFTPYGFKLACEQAGLKLNRVYPKFDAITWLLRRLLISTSGSDENSLSKYMSSSNAIGDLFIDYGRRQGLDCVKTNLFRLQFSSHFVFEVEKPQN